MVGDHPLGDVAQRAVVDGVVEGVAPPGGAEVEVEVEVDLERLGLRLLVGQHADDARQPQAAELDDVAGGHALLRDGGGEGDQVAPERAHLP